jgi:hypothetical protein
VLQNAALSFVLFIQLTYLLGCKNNKYKNNPKASESLSRTEVRLLVNAPSFSAN